MLFQKGNENIDGARRVTNRPDFQRTPER